MLCYILASRHGVWGVEALVLLGAPLVIVSASLSLYIHNIHIYIICVCVYIYIYIYTTTNNNDMYTHTYVCVIYIYIYTNILWVMQTQPNTAFGHLNSFKTTPTPNPEKLSNYDSITKRQYALLWSSCWNAFGFRCRRSGNLSSLRVLFAGPHHWRLFRFLLEQSAFVLYRPGTLNIGSVRICGQLLSWVTKPYALPPFAQPSSPTPCSRADK